MFHRDTETVTGRYDRGGGGDGVSHMASYGVKPFESQKPVS